MANLPHQPIVVLLQFDDPLGPVPERVPECSRRRYREESPVKGNEARDETSIRNLPLRWHFF